MNTGARLPDATTSPPSAAPAASPAALADERYRVIVQHSRDIVLFIRRVDGRIVEGNAAAVIAYGWSPEELRARTIHDLRAPGTILLAEPQMAEAESSGLLFETVHRRCDGSEFPVEVSSRGVVVDGERMLVSVVRDIGQRRRAEEFLSESQRRYRELLAQFPDGVLFYRAGGVEYANPAAVRLLGAAHERDLVGRGAHELIHPDFHAAVDELMPRALAGEAVPMREIVITRLDGSTRVVEAAGARFTDAEGDAIQVILHDVTERRAREAAVRATELHEVSRQAEARFRALIGDSADLLLVADARGAIAFWSPGAEALLGWPASEILGRDAMGLVHPADVEAARRDLANQLGHEGASNRRTMRVRHRDGSWRWIDSLSRNLLHDPNVRGVVINAHDVTEQRELQRQLLESQKLEGIGQLAGGVAHDFNNLLTAILGGAEGVFGALESGTPVSREDVESIRQAGERARALTRQLLSFARRDPIVPAPLDPNALVRETEKLLRRVLPENIAVVTDLDPGVGRLLGDLAQLQQVLLNLSVNARDAMPDGGTLSITTRPSAFGEDEARAAGLDAACACVRLTVSDTGVGMDEVVREHLFEPFFTTKPSGKGTGLGLAAVYGVVSRNHGRIRVESEPGHGSTFTIDLPCTSVQEDPRARRAAAPAGGSETVLLVEDERLVRGIAARSLRGAGYRVLDAAGASEALEAVAALNGPVHALVTDVVMPGMNGVGLAERLRARHPGLRVLFVSGYAQDALGEGTVLQDGTEFLQKPFEMSALLARVRRLLDGPGPLGA